MIDKYFNALAKFLTRPQVAFKSAAH